MRLLALSVAAIATGLSALALGSRYLQAAPPVLVVSTVSATVAVVVLCFQPVWALLAKRQPRAFGWHWPLGLVVLALVAVHVGGLVVLSPEDVAFALSLDGPTRARMAVLATAALVVVVALGVARRLLAWHGPEFAVLHGFFAAWAVLLGLGHAVLTDGALDGPGTVGMLALAALGTTGVVAARVRDVRGRHRGRTSAADAELP